MHPILRFWLLATPVGLILFLALSGFFTCWEGRVVSHRPSVDEDPPYLPVLIVSDDGDWQERPWPTATVRTLKVPADPSGYPPTQVPAGVPTTMKLRGTLSFLVSREGEPTISIPTTSPQALASTVLGLILMFFGHNMWLTGSPLRWWHQDPPEGAPDDDPSQPQPGTPGAQVARQRPRFGPPPPNPRVGRGRR